MTTGRTGGSGRYRPGRKRRLGTALFTLLAAAIAATVLVALGARTISARATCAGQTTTAQVAVSSEIEPVIQRVATYFNSQHRQVDGRCAAVAVHAAAAATSARPASLSRVTSIERAANPAATARLITFSPSATKSPWAGSMLVRSRTSVRRA